MIRVTVLADDRVRRRGLLAEHGLSLWIEKDDRKILFDTGQTSVFCQNAKTLGIHIETADSVVLSHGHYDHCGGLRFFPCGNIRPKVYIHPDALLKKYSSVDQDEPYHEVGVSWKISDINWLQDRIVCVRQPATAGKGIMVSGEIPRTNDFEETPKGFYLEKNGQMQPDIIMDEQMLIIEDENEIAVFLGCSHPGVVNCLSYARELFPGRAIKLLVAGMHMENISKTRFEKTIRYIQDVNISQIVPLHCTGIMEMCEMKHVLGEQCRLYSAGNVFIV